MKLLFKNLHEGMSSNHFIVHSDDDLDHYSTPSSDVETISTDIEEEESLSQTTSDKKDDTVRNHHHSSINSRRTVAGTAVTANLLSMMAKVPTGRGGRGSDRDLTTSTSLPSLSRHNGTLPSSPAFRLVRKNLSSDTGLDNIISSPGSPTTVPRARHKAIFGHGMNDDAPLRRQRVF